MSNARCTRHPGRRRKLLLLLVAALALSAAGVAAAKPGKPAQKTAGVAYVGVTHVEGSDIYVSGEFKDELFGRGALVYVTQVQAGPQPASVLIQAHKVTLYTKRGSLRGTAQAVETLNPDGTGTISDGTFKLKKGTGDYKGHKFKGTLEGSYADGVYTFNYEGTYK
jgi:hypothetical protein